jgi:hypothetical protein
MLYVQAHVGHRLTYCTHNTHTKTHKNTHTLEGITHAYCTYKHAYAQIRLHTQRLHTRFGGICLHAHGRLAVTPAVSFIPEFAQGTHVHRDAMMIEFVYMYASRPVFVVYILVTAMHNRVSAIKWRVDMRTYTCMPMYALHMNKQESFDIRSTCY